MNQNLRKSNNFLTINRLVEFIALFFNNLESVQLGVCTDGDSRHFNQICKKIKNE
jgi:hypothetical protein